MFFKWTGARDDELIDLAFNKKRADDRKARSVRGFGRLLFFFLGGGALGSRWFVKLLVGVSESRGTQ